MGHQSHSVTAQRWLGGWGGPDLFVVPVSALSTCGFQILGACVLCVWRKGDPLCSG